MYKIILGRFETDILTQRENNITLCSPDIRGAK